jgi:hypothetical protein
MSNIVQFKAKEEVLTKPTTEKDVIAMYGLETIDRPIESDAGIDYLVTAFAKNRAEMEKLKVLESELRDRICAYMGKHDALIDSKGQKLVQWSYKKAPELFDRAAFKSAYPELEKRFTKSGEPCRAFSVLVKVV